MRRTQPPLLLTQRTVLARATEMSTAPKSHNFAVPRVSSDGYMYGTCLIVYESRGKRRSGDRADVKSRPRPRALVLTSCWPVHATMLALLKIIYRLSLSRAPLPIEHYLHHIMYKVPVPPANGDTRYVLTLGDAWCYVERPPTLAGLPPAILDVDFRNIVECVSLGSVVRALAAAACERSVYVVGSDRSVVADAVILVRALLTPFQWQGSFAPLLPGNDIPTDNSPCLVGLHASRARAVAAAAAATRGVVWDLSTGRVEAAAGAPDIVCIPTVVREDLTDKLDAASGAWTAMGLMSPSAAWSPRRGVGVAADASPAHSSPAVSTNPKSRLAAALSIPITSLPTDAKTTVAQRLPEGLSRAGAVAQQQVQRAVFGFWADLLWNWKDFSRPGAGIDDPAAFDADAFVRALPEPNRAFVRALTRTGMFRKFIGGGSAAYFDALASWLAMREQNQSIGLPSLADANRRVNTRVIPAPGLPPGAAPEAGINLERRVRSERGEDDTDAQLQELADCMQREMQYEKLWRRASKGWAYSFFPRLRTGLFPIDGATLRASTEHDEDERRVRAALQSARDEEQKRLMIHSAAEQVKRQRARAKQRKWDFNLGPVATRLLRDCGQVATDFQALRRAVVSAAATVSEPRSGADDGGEAKTKERSEAPSSGSAAVSAAGVRDGIALVDYMSARGILNNNIPSRAAALLAAIDASHPLHGRFARVARYSKRVHGGSKGSAAMSPVSQLKYEALGRDAQALAHALAPTPQSGDGEEGEGVSAVQAELDTLADAREGARRDHKGFSLDQDSKDLPRSLREGSTSLLESLLVAQEGRDIFEAPYDGQEDGTAIEDMLRRTRHLCAGLGMDAI